MANISRNNASVLMIISTLIIIFILVTFFVISENNFNDNLEQGAASANNNVSPNNVNANNSANETAEESEVDYSGYNNDRKQVFNVSENDYTYEEARAVCKAYGGDLATLEQMIEAHKKGANWCNYGWSDGQMALYPTQKIKSLKLLLL